MLAFWLLGAPQHAFPRIELPDHLLANVGRCNRSRKQGPQGRIPSVSIGVAKGQLDQNGAQTTTRKKISSRHGALSVSHFLPYAGTLTNASSLVGPSRIKKKDRPDYTLIAGSLKRTTSETGSVARTLAQYSVLKETRESLLFCPVGNRDRHHERTPQTCVRSLFLSAERNRHNPRM